MNPKVDEYIGKDGNGEWAERIKKFNPTLTPSRKTSNVLKNLIHSLEFLDYYK